MVPAATVAKSVAELEQSKAALKQALATAQSTNAQLELQRYAFRLGSQ